MRGATSESGATNGWTTPHYLAKKYRMGGTDAPKRSNTTASHRGLVTRNATRMPTIVVAARNNATTAAETLNAVAEGEESRCSAI
jgi:hypothetical protein